VRSRDHIERRILTGLIISSEFVKKVQDIWHGSRFIETPEIGQVGQWCMDHYAQYGSAPSRDIESIYIEHLHQGGIGKAEAELIEQLLLRVSQDYENEGAFNPEYLYDRTVAYFQERELRLVIEDADILHDRGKVDDAQALIRNFKPTIGKRRARRADTITPLRIRWYWELVIHRGKNWCWLRAGRDSANPRSWCRLLRSYPPVDTGPTVAKVNPMI